MTSPTPASEKPRIIVYRDRLLPRSEHESIRNQYCRFTRIEPVYVGRHRDNPPSFLERRHFIGRAGALGILKRAMFKRTGRGAEDIIKKEHPRLIHAQFFSSGLLVLPVAKHYQIPLVVTCYSSDLYRKSHQGKPLNKKSFAKECGALVNFASLFIAVSPDIAEKLKQLGVPEDKIKTIPIGVPDKGTAAENTQHSLLMVAPFIQKKAFDPLLDAMEALGNHNQAPHLIISGEGPYKKAFRKQLKRRKLSSVELIGPLTSQQLHEYFNDVSAVMIPQIDGLEISAETWPMLVKEALMAGMPVLADSKTPVPVDALIKAGGMKAPFGDARALAAAIEDLLYEGANYLPNRHMYARAFALTHFEDTLLSGELENTLISVIRQKQRRGKVTS